MFSLNKGYLFGGSHNKEYSIWGSVLRSPYLGKLPLLLRVERLGLRDWGLGLRFLGFSYSKVEDEGSRVSGLGSTVSGFGLRIKGLG